MRNRQWPTALLAILTLFAARFATAVPARLEFFYQPGCAECERVKDRVLPQLRERYEGFFEWVPVDIGEEKNFLRLAAYQDKLKLETNAPVSVILNGREALVGYERIETELLEKVAEAISDAAAATPPEPDAPTALSKDRLDRLTLGVAAVAGLVDGVNPCAMSTLVFFISVLTALKLNKRTILLAGGAFCLACFLTYLALGLGLAHAVGKIESARWLKQGFNATMGAAMVLLAALSFRDAWAYRKRQSPDAIWIKLPKSWKRFGDRVAGDLARGRHLYSGVFLAGAVVTLIESACTGQIYLPTLTLMVRHESVFSKWFVYLLIYNLMFVLPLIVLLFAACGGAGVLTLISWSKRDAVIGKVLMGVLFLWLAAFFWLF